ncbi:MAG: hypothetical protein CSYNP_02477 [Syntrophus sp. SKADARSKE-3]|nr:hypothetical protein [Syntrophus sp. SKADARSKE-3]
MSINRKAGYPNYSKQIMEDYQMMENNAVHRPFLPCCYGKRYLVELMVILLVFIIPVFLYGASPDPGKLPTGGTITQGMGGIAQSGSKMTVTQTTQKMVANWQSFSIGSNAWVDFRQPNSSAIVLNRVLGSDPSSIFGRLTANGQVFLINPNGILFGQGSSVNTGGLVASTMSISDGDFMSGKYQFTKSGAAGSIVNQGQLTAADGGYIALLSPEIRNEGIVTAKLGTVALAAGNKVTLDFAGDGFIKMAVDETVVNAQINNRGFIKADGGQVMMTARAADSLMNTVINNEGVIEAKSVVDKNGEIYLTGSENGVVNVSGRVDASGRENGQKGGTVKVLGALVALTGNAGIDVSGDAGGGTALIGGNYQGKGPEQSAKATAVGKDVKINADAINTGNGGKVIVWSDDKTNFEGTISAKGGLQGGDGGFVEASGHKLTIGNTAFVDTRALLGRSGKWLLDPQDFTIAASGGDMTGAALSGNLRGGNVTILSSSGKTSGSGDINVNDAVSWSANTLTLTAAHDININSVMTAKGTSALVMNAATANGSDVIMPGGNIKVGFNSDGTFMGRVDFFQADGVTPRSGAGFLTINTKGYTAINALSDLQNMNSSLAGNYALVANVDASATSGWNGGAGFMPIGNNKTYFTGGFDGLGHTITGLYINRPITTVVGLFGYVANGSTIRNVGLVNMNITGQKNVGGLVGWSNGSISNSYSTGAVTGSGSVGGLVGWNDGDLGGWGRESLLEFTLQGIHNSYSTGTITGGGDAGGLVGWNRGIISNSYSTGAVTGGDSVGGLVGANTGGVVGRSLQGITDSYSTGAVTGSSNVGGLVGYNGGNANGRLLGCNEGIISNSYSTGMVTGSNYVAGLVGSNDGSISNSYWDKQSSGQTVGVGYGSSNANGVTGLSTAKMKRQASFSGWDIAGTDGSSAIWRIFENNSYPLLKSFLMPLTVTADNRSKTYDGYACSGGYKYVNGPLTVSNALPIISAKSDSKSYDGSMVSSVIPRTGNPGLMTGDSFTVPYQLFDLTDSVKRILKPVVVINDGNIANKL